LGAEVKMGVDKDNVRVAEGESRRVEEKEGGNDDFGNETRQN
jgi:hypothetical protein